MINRESSLSKQQGVVLVVCLVMLLLMTLIGITGMQTTGLEEKMAGNSRDQNLAFQAAESTLLEAEKFILGNSTTTTYQGNILSPGLLDISNNAPHTEPVSYFTTSNWTAANSAPTPVGYKNNFGILEDPRYIIKKIALISATGVNGPKTVFKITARAVGRNAGTQVILQELFEREN